MSLLGSAAILLCFDIAPEAVAEHDDWHTHEHLPERLSIPGFLRGSRWVAQRGHPRYLVLYEVADVDTLTSAAYLERLNHPTPWTSRMMPYYRGMTRGLCAVAGSWGLGLGNVAHLTRFAPGAGDVVWRWLLAELGPSLPAMRGVGSVHVLRGASAAPMTNEQRIRGTDAGVDAALLVVGYESDALVALTRTLVSREQFERRGATVTADSIHAFDYVLTRGEVTRPGPSSGA